MQITKTFTNNTKTLQYVNSKKKTKIKKKLKDIEILTIKTKQKSSTEFHSIYEQTLNVS